MSSFSIDTRSLLAMAHGYAGAGPIVADEMTNATRRCVLAVEAGAKRDAPVLTGTLRRSITNDVRALGGVLQGLVGSNVPYARIAEFGFPPARSGLKGRKAHPYLLKSFREQQPRFAAEFAAAERRALARIVANQR